MVGNTRAAGTPLVMNTHVVGLLPRFELTPSALKVLWTMIQLHPAIAGYVSVEEMTTEIKRAAASPLVPPLTIPDYQVLPPREQGKARLSAVG